MNARSLYYRSDEFHSETVPQGRNEWVNYPEIDQRMPGLFAARATIAPNQGHDFHLHPGREEIVYVLEGTIAQWIGRERQVLRAGDVALIPAGKVHASFNLGSKPAVLFVVLSAARSAEALAIDVAQEAPWRSMRTP